MIALESAPTFLIHSIFVLLVISISTFQWGKKTPGSGSWLVWTGILALLVSIGLDSGVLLQEVFRTKVWKVGWIWPREELGAITVGMLQDPLSLSMSALAALIVGAFLVNKEIIQSELHLERVYSALALSTAGVVLAWNALTPWLVFGGLVLTIVGGFVSLASRWDTNREALVASRFGWERSSGFLLAFFGACILATSRSALSLNELDGWASNSSSMTSTWVGSCFLVAGLFVQMQPFPLVGWIVSGSEISPPLRILLNQIFPAWAAFPLLLRLEPQLHKLGLFPGFGWVALFSAILITVSGLFQREWRIGLSSWLAAAFSLSCALLAFSGPFTATGLLIGVSLGALSISAGAVALERKCSENSSYKNRAIWVKVACFMAVASGTGVIGFVSASAGVRWIGSALSLPGIIPMFIVVFFFFVLLGWKLGWQIIRSRKATDTSWLSVASIFFWIVLSSGIIWTGTITGECLLEHPDRVMTSLFDIFFAGNGNEVNNSSEFISASGLYWGAMVLAFFAAYWASGRRESRWAFLEAAIPKTSEFIAGGYGIDGIVRRLSIGTSWVGAILEKVVDDKVWSEWMPECLSIGFKNISNFINIFDERLTTILEECLSRWVGIPAKTLQLAQTGDVRWYLFLSLGLGFALLLHFLKA